MAKNSKAGAVPPVDTPGCRYMISKHTAVARGQIKPPTYTWEGDDYTDKLRWTGKKDVPDLGIKVRINFNSFGTGTVVGYFEEYGFAGVVVKLDNDPDWHVRQCKGTWHAGMVLAFGNDLEVIE